MTQNKKRWDLSSLVPSTDTDQIIQLYDQLVVVSQNFATQYKGNIASFDAKHLLKFLQDWEQLFLNRVGPLKYARLKYDANSLESESKKLADIERRTRMKINQNMTFMDVELAKLIAEKPELINHPQLADYKHYLERIHRQSPHILSDIEERLLIQKDRFGNDAWEQLQGDWLSTRTFEIELDGEAKVIPYGEIIALYEHPSREVRKAAYSIVYKKLGQDEILWASALRAIIGDHIETSKLRKWSTPRTQSLIDNDLDGQTIDALMAVVEKNVGLYHRFLRIKAALMGIPKLANYDVVAPLPDVPERKFPWEEARKICIEIYSNFDPQFGKIITHMFDDRHIDGEVRKGKRSGAYCSTDFKGKSAFILQSYNEYLGDLFTLVHENGHAIHATLNTTHQTPLNTEISYCVAETGSIFGELLLADKLITDATTSAEKIQVLTKVLDEFGMTVFQVSARYFFETDLYDAFIQGEYLDGDTISKYWVKGRDKIYRDSIEWLPEMKWEWTMKLHYYIPRFRYYNYPYVYANLFVFALYRMFKEEGGDFVPKLRKLLSEGSTKSPRDVAAELGFDITSEEFWELGMKQAEEFIDELEQLSAK
jgi:oligoendopeptidase F